MEVFDEFDAVVDKILGLSFDAMTPAEKLALHSRVERNLRPTVRSPPDSEAAVLVGRSLQASGASGIPTVSRQFATASQPRYVPAKMSWPRCSPPATSLGTSTV